MIPGKGSALEALRCWGAVYGQGVGPQGRSYAIPTRTRCFTTLPLWKIEEYVEDFIAFATSRPDLTFYVSAIGTGLAGYSHEQIAPMFVNVPMNVQLPKEWRDILACRIREKIN